MLQKNKQIMVKAKFIDWNYVKDSTSIPTALCFIQPSADMLQKRN